MRGAWLANPVRCAWLLLPMVAIALGSDAASAVDFEKEIAPLIARRCLECHNEREPKGELNLTTNGGLAEVGGERLLERVVAGEMPPERQGKSQALPEAEIALLRAWVESGASWPDGRVLDADERTSDVRGGRDWWSLQPVNRPALPQPAPNPIDAFILARLKADGMRPAPRADKRTLARRVYFDLTGLPPTPAELAAYLADDTATAYAQLVDRLLASPRYGERWARYWLDLVRFAETDGYERDTLKSGIWRYRDWVIDAFNADMPYTQFVRDQLAGDEVSYRDERSVIATGMLRAGTWNDEPNDAADYLYERLEDMVHTTSSAFLALTVKCARCHDHKFDPIRQSDYYRLASFFWAGPIGQGNQGGPSHEQLGFSVFGWTDNGPTPQPIRLLQQGERHKPGPEIAPGFLSAIPSLDKPLAPPPAGAKTTTRRLQFATWITDPRNPLTARVLVNRLWQHHFGEGLVRTPNNFGFKCDLPTHPELLDWLAAEVIEPTVGVGNGAGAAWTLKRMHRLILLSETYQMASLHPDEAAYQERDPLNRSWWKFNRRRLDAEALRDSMLAVSGALNLKMGGPSFFPEMSAEALEGLSRKAGAWSESSPEERARRSVYMMTMRSRLLPLMTTFDFSETTSSCDRREVTTVAPQALALLNNHFVHSQSEAFARRLIKEHADLPAQITAAWQLAFGRNPKPDEIAVAERHVREQSEHFRASPDRERLALASLCHVLLNTNEFIYVD